MNTYVIIHKQQIPLEDIGDYKPKTRFEEELVGFIHDWKSGQKSFQQSTSGSTGKPKLIEITRSQMMASALLTIAALQLKQNHNCLLCLSPEYIAGKMMIARALINKMNIVAVEPALNPILSLEGPVHFAALTPMQLFHILQHAPSKEKLNTFDIIILGGGIIPYALQKQIEQLKPKIYSTYGMTETVSHIALKKLNGIDRSSFYHAFEGIELNQDNRDCLTIKGAVTNNVKIITNDRVQLMNDRQFEWLGRVDNVINSGGIKIQSEKVESKIEKIFDDLALTNRFFLTGFPHDAQGEQAVLIIEGPVPDEDRVQLDYKLKDHLQKYEIPKKIFYIPHFEETPTGKINRTETIRQVS